MSTSTESNSICSAQRFRCQNVLVRKRSRVSGKFTRVRWHLPPIRAVLLARRSGLCPFQGVPDTPCRDLEEETWLHFATRQRWRGGGFQVDKDRAQMEPGLLTHAPTPIPTRSLLSGLPGTQQEPVRQSERGGETYVLAQPPIPAVQKLHPRLLAEKEMPSWGQRVGDQAGTDSALWRVSWTKQTMTTSARPVPARLAPLCLGQKWVHRFFP